MTQDRQWNDDDSRASDVARVLAMDSVEAAGSGHPGTAMALAPLAHLLYHYVLRHDPKQPDWLGRDRLVLSCGHASMLLYAQLFLTGYDLSLEDLQQFRRHDSKTPGHPEFRHTPGVEMTTGPLGQGLATAVGMAIGRRYLRRLFDHSAEPGASPFDHRVFVIASDGDLQEGVSAEASSLAGHQQLEGLIVFWDDNRISIDGDTGLSFTEDVMARYESYGWETHSVPMQANGDLDAPNLLGLLDSLPLMPERPIFVRVQTTIAFPAPNSRDTAAAHGAPLGTDEVAATKGLLGVSADAQFDVSDQVLTYTRKAIDAGQRAREEWLKGLESWREREPKAAGLLDRLVSNKLPHDLLDDWPSFDGTESISTRKASGKVIQALAEKLPEMLGGSADLTESNSTHITGGASGRYIHFGVREHAMAAALNGMALTGLLRPFGGTFLIFSDYQRPAIRLAALMGIRSTFVWTHDSIGLGEDGPTHQPIEQLWSLRAIPKFAVIRPADANETAWCWRELMERDAPCGIALTRQNVPVLDQQKYASASSCKHGAYVVDPADVKDQANPDALILATGSEVALGLAAKEILSAEGIRVNVVSMPCLEWFDAEPEAYRDSVLPPAVKARVSVEAGSTLGWYRYIGDFGVALGVTEFGGSSSPQALYDRFQLTPENVAAQVKHSIALASKGSL